jgi:hypothetical protein
MKTRIFAAALMSVLLQLSAWGQGFGQLQIPDQPSRNANVVQGLLTIISMPTDIQSAPNGNKMDMSVTSTRGGNNSGKPLGMYGIGGDLEFRSDYKNLDAQTMANWAYDLHQHVLGAGGGWENYQRYSKDNAPDPVERSMVPYDKLRDFAEHYWDHYGGDKFKHMASMYRGWWLNDSIIDGEHVYLEYQQRLGGYGSADFVTYKDAVLADILKKK